MHWTPIELPGEFKVDDPRMRDLRGSLEENCVIAYNVLFTDIVAPALKMGMKSETMLRLLVNRYHQIFEDMAPRR